MRSGRDRDVSMLRNLPEHRAMLREIKLPGVMND
jgi:hypothetical protein